MSENRNQDRMDLGQKVLDWLYREQLQIEDKWAVRFPDGFIWWPADFSQVIRLVGREIGAFGDTGYLIMIETDFLRYNVREESDLSLINKRIMPYASLAGPIIYPRHERITLNTAIRVYHKNYRNISRLIKAAAILQIIEVLEYTESFKGLPGYQFEGGEHPESGIRERPDPSILAEASRIKAAGLWPVRFGSDVFEQAAADISAYRYARKSGFCNTGIIVEYPFLGGSSVVVKLETAQNHPRYGNGLLVIQSFPISMTSDEKALWLVNNLNQQELIVSPLGHGMGSYCYMNGNLFFFAFFPNLILNFVDPFNQAFSCGGRTLELDRRFRTGFHLGRDTESGYNSSARMHNHILGVGEN